MKLIKLKNSTADLDAGTYTYYAFASDVNGNGNSTDTRSVNITGGSSFNSTSSNQTFNLSYDNAGNLNSGLDKNYT